MLGEGFRLILRKKLMEMGCSRCLRVISCLWMCLKVVLCRRNNKLRKKQ